jgi:hypothetical protein
VTTKKGKSKVTCTVVLRGATGSAPRVRMRVTHHGRLVASGARRPRAVAGGVHRATLSVPGGGGPGWRWVVEFVDPEGPHWITSGRLSRPT